MFENNNQNTTLTGGNGFVGVNLAAFLKAKDFRNVYSHSLRKIEEFAVSKETAAIVHLAGKAHDTKNESGAEEYYIVNTELTKKVFDAFLKSKAKTFIFISSVKAVADSLKNTLNEDVVPNPLTHYGKSKLLAEQYICSRNWEGRQVYILRPCMIHGSNNKGNLNLLYEFVKKTRLYPLGLFTNKRSYLSIENLCFVISELISRDDIPSGVYNIADDESLCTTDVINIIKEVSETKIQILNIPKILIRLAARIGDLLSLPLNSEKIKKLTESYIVSNTKLLTALNKPLPVSSTEGMRRTIKSFSS